MAADSSNTKPEPGSLNQVNWISATELGDNIIAQGKHWVVAHVDIQEVLAGGCDAALEIELNGQKDYVNPPPGRLPPDRLRWVNRLNPSMRREDYPDRPWQWELRAYLSPSEPWEFRHLEGCPIAREQVSTTLRVFLRRAEAAHWGLPSESPQAVASEKRPSPYEQPGEATVGSAGREAVAAPASAVDAAAPVANTEALAAEPEAATSSPVDAMTTEPQQQQIPRLSSRKQSQWLKTALADNPPGEDEPITPEGYGKRIAEMGKPLGAMYEPSSVIARYYQLNPDAPRRRKPRK